MPYSYRVDQQTRRTMTRQGEQNQWDGSGMSQEDFMIKDECITLDENDSITGHANKYVPNI